MPRSVALDGNIGEGHSKKTNGGWGTFTSVQGKKERRGRGDEAPLARAHPAMRLKEEAFKISPGMESIKMLFKI